MFRVEEEFGVCFPDTAWDKDWDLPAFAAYVEARMKRPDANLEEAQKSPFRDIYPFLQIPLIPLILLPFLLRSPPSFVWLLFFFAAALDGRLTYLWVRSTLHARTVVARIRQKSLATVSYDATLMRGRKG
jgi:hypothetical protein